MNPSRHIMMREGFYDGQEDASAGSRLYGRRFYAGAYAAGSGSASGAGEKNIRYAEHDPLRISGGRSGARALSAREDLGQIDEAL